MAEHEEERPAPAAADSPGLEQAWQQALQAHARYYEAWGQLASRWMRDLAEIGRVTRLPKLPPLRLSTMSAPHEAAAPAPTRSPVPPAADEPAPAVLVLEGAAGDVVMGAFLVENSLPHPVDGAVEVDRFQDSHGAAVLARLDFEPSAVSLSPGERRLVRVRAELPPTLPANVDCRSTVRVLGVPGTTIP
ncbi:MAG: hypothetical protein QOJ49_763, partial [Actinomycetota bacterium]|nr:hypothetical protein [Actinomycetota bacterium]